MPEYRVEWSIDIDADNPVDAALEALAIQRDPQSTATVFNVSLADSDNFVVVDTAQHKGI